MKAIRCSREYARASIIEDRWRYQVVFNTDRAGGRFRYRQRCTMQVLTDNTKTGHRGY